jgi:hypothetical protein
MSILSAHADASMRPEVGPIANVAGSGFPGGGGADGALRSTAVGAGPEAGPRAAPAHRFP